MTPTTIQLLAIHKAPAVPLAEISKRYLNLSPEEAARMAALHKLPFPTFSLRESQKAPLMVHLEDLAEHIDRARRCAIKSWEHSQV